MSDIEEDMQYFIQDIDILINNIINMQERTATGIVTVRQPLIVKIYSLLNNYKRLELRVKELEEEKQKYIVQLTDEQYRNLVDIIRKEAKQEFEQKVKDLLTEIQEEYNKVQEQFDCIWNKKSKDDYDRYKLQELSAMQQQLGFFIGKLEEMLEDK